MSTMEWEQFAVGEVSTNPKWTAQDCRPLRFVAHVAHVPTAVRIVEDGKLRAGLIYDKSRLNTDRTQVVWLSPNDWHGAGGFRYGNVRFLFDLEPLIANKNYYWVESIAYGIKACRILLTDKDYSKSLQPYDPAAHRGPWWRSPDGAHYWNGRYCLELMIESDLDLKTVKSIDFVDHHAKRCNIDTQACPYRGKMAGQAGAEFLGILLARHIKLGLPGFTEQGDTNLDLSSELRDAVRWLHAAVEHIRPASWGSLKGDHPSANGLARSLAWYAAAAMEENARNALGLFTSQNDAWTAVLQQLSEGTGIPIAAFPGYRADTTEAG